MPTLNRSFRLRALDTEGGPSRFCLSTEVSARDGNVWLQNYRDADLEHGLPMLWSHDVNTPPLGRWVDLRVVDGPTGRELHGTPVFDDSEDNPLARLVGRQVRQGIIDRVSLSIRPGSVEPASSLPRDSAHYGESGLVIGRNEPNELLEASVVVIPADPHASPRSHAEDAEVSVRDALLALLRSDEEVRTAIQAAPLAEVDEDAAWWAGFGE